MNPTTSTERTFMLSSARIGQTEMYINADGFVVNGKELKFKNQIGETKPDSVVDMKLTKEMNLSQGIHVSRNGKRRQKRRGLAFLIRDT